MQDSKTISFDTVVNFHGHACPGLALGYRVALAAMRWLHSGRSEDEEFVAVIENDACGVDAIQAVCGCTFGKGNLIFRDHGKQAFTFFNRATGEGIRYYAEPVYMDDPDDPEFVALAKIPKRTGSEEEAFREIMQRRIQRILSMPEEEFLTLSQPLEPMPTKARIFGSARCDACRERVMETRITAVGDRKLCPFCLATSS